MMPTPAPTIFLDRDGVINVDSPTYIKSWEEFVFIDGSLDALRILSENHFRVILITNQSVINRKMVPPAELNRIFTLMKKQISDAGGRITDIFYCPHTPQEHCDCRKPKAGLIRQARNLYQIDLPSACMIGDSTKDILCGKQAGCGKTILVRTGNGREAEKALARQNQSPDHIADNLLDAAYWIVRRYLRHGDY